MKRVPVTLQMSAADCGAACLNMITRYWGGHISTKVCQELLGGNGGGSTALQIVRAAGQLGLEAQGFRHTLAGLARAELPAIVHWQGVHFVVLESWGDREVKIVDPAVGRRTISPDTFAELYSGVTLTFKPTDQFANFLAQYTRLDSDKIWRTYFKQIWQIPNGCRLISLVLLTSLLLQLGGLILPFGTWLIVEQIMPQNGMISLGSFGLVLLLAVLGQTAVVYGRAILVTRLQQTLDSWLMPNFFRRLTSLPYSFFQQRTTGDLIARLEGNSVIRELITSGILTGVLDGGLALLYLLILFVQAPLFGVVVAIAAVLQIGLMVYMSEPLHEHSQMALATQAEENGYAVQALRGIESVKAAGAEEWIYAAWQIRFNETLAASLQRETYQASVHSFLHLFSFATPLALLWMGSWLVQIGQLSLGQMLALVVLASSSLAPLSNVAFYLQRAQQLWAYLERLADVLETEPEDQGELAAAVPELNGRIEMKDISFRYRSDGGAELQDISFIIEPGTKVALVGISGAGKSTLIRLLLGLYQPDHGDILYDGRPISDFNLTLLRQQIGAVLQQPFIFNGTIRQNMMFHNPDLSEQEMIAAAKLACLHEDIESWPLGYGTHVGEGGSGLSSGQRQRLALACVLAKRPQILILDEATSHLDEAMEKRVYNNLDQLNLTRIVIAHRSSTILNADQYLYLTDGTLDKQMCWGVRQDGQ